MLADPGRCPGGKGNPLPGGGAPGDSHAAVASQYIRVPQSEIIDSIAVLSGPDEADDRIVELVQAGDLVTTADIPLADRVVAKDATALDPRGTLLTEANIKERLATRALLDELRSAELVGVPQAENIDGIAVLSGPDEADARIVELVQAGDLVITADIPLADRVAAGARISEESLKSAQ